MQNVKFIVSGAVFGLAMLGFGVPAVQAQNAPVAKQILQTDLAAVSPQEALIFVVEFAPGQSLPWHSHPDGHELGYMLEGTLVIEDQNQKKVTLKAGEGNHILPNVGHTARNEGTTPAKILVVRVKDKTKPITAPFQR